VNIHQRILEVSRVCSYIKKDTRVSVGGRSYLGISYDAVAAALRGPMISAGVIMSVSVVESTTTDGATHKGAPKVVYRGRFRVTLYNVEEPSDSISYEVDAHAEDANDKAPGKALSYAVKSALLKAFLLETGENDESRPDGTAHTETPSTGEQPAEEAAQARQLMLEQLDALFKEANVPHERVDAWAIRTYGRGLRDLSPAQLLNIRDKALPKMIEKIRQEQEDASAEQD